MIVRFSPYKTHRGAACEGSPEEAQLRSGEQRWAPPATRMLDYHRHLGVRGLPPLGYKTRQGRAGGKTNHGKKNISRRRVDGDAILAEVIVEARPHLFNAPPPSARYPAADAQRVTRTATSVTQAQQCPPPLLSSSLPLGRRTRAPLAWCVIVLVIVIIDIITQLTNTGPCHFPGSLTELPGDGERTILGGKPGQAATRLLKQQIAPARFRRCSSGRCS